MSTRIADLVGAIPLDDMPVETQICEADGIYIKQIAVPKRGTILGQHAHQLSHLSLLARGAVRLRRGHWTAAVMEEGEEFHAPVGIHIPAGELHSFETLTDDVVLYCVHALGTPEALKILAHHGVVA